MVEVDGKMVAATSIDLHVDCESLPQAVISLPALDGLSVDVEGNIYLDEVTKQLLIALGWRPPSHKCI